MKLTVYHGTDCLFDKIDLKKSVNRRDFGIGFYTTTICSQAESWARSRKLRNHSEHAYVYVYEVEISEEDLAVKKFDGLTVEWLNMVRDNRKLGGTQHHYDVMVGPVANDNTMLTVTRYIQGTYTAEEAAYLNGLYGDIESDIAVDFAIAQLMPDRLKNQYCFLSNKAVKCLEPVEVIRYEQ